MLASRGQGASTTMTPDPSPSDGLQLLSCTRTECCPKQPDLSKATSGEPAGSKKERLWEDGRLSNTAGFSKESSGEPAGSKKGKRQS